MNNDYNNFQPAPQGPQPGQGAATGSLVCGIISLVAGIVLGWTFYMALVGMVIGVVGIVLGINAKKQGYIGGMQTAGLVISIIGTVIGSIVFIACAACVCVSSAIVNSYEYDDIESIINSIAAGI